MERQPAETTAASPVPRHLRSALGGRVLERGEGDGEGRGGEEAAEGEGLHLNSPLPPAVALG